MGCWNGTCAVTGLPIFWEDEVVVILLKTQPQFDGGSFCDQYEYQAPLPLTFSGQYNDYGAVENCDGPALNVIVENIRKNLMELEPDEERHRFENGFKREDFDIEALFKLDHAGRLYIRTYGRMQHDMRETNRITHITIHKHVYQSIVDQMMFETWRKTDDSFETLEITLESYRTEYGQFINNIDDLIRIEIELAKEDGDDNGIAAIKRQMRFQMDGSVGETMVSKIIGERGHGIYSMMHPIRLTDLFVDMRKRDEDITDILDNAVMFYIFNIFMSQSRRSWHKPSGSGSQDSEITTQTMAAKLTLEMAEIITKRWEEYEE